ncbi:fec operon regulator FecR [Mariniflexile rhizosphaerae]|uniref:FecR family protein n=1 Tax=unclassified Mariniflexile TaxID=2643887 RepID=UPI000CC92E31|nr:FecR domain-containing protein [Mariniflexile sp. TRM1-10]AXP82048.1 fec operon regulator FecR [Mariniflexile sp. TRM1-10]PLB20314.1 MAG: Anti-sigma factor [Flavobacteriaceae bacterium FS1-H7996/R]
MNDVFHIAILVIKKKFKILTKVEELQLEQFKDKYLFIKNIRFDSLKQKVSEHATIDKEKAWNIIVDKLENRSKKSQILLFRRTWFKYAAAASIVVLLSLSYLAINNIKQANTHPPVIVNTTIKAGTDKAILTLGDGSEVNLDTETPYQSKNIHSNGKQITYKPKTDSGTAEITYNYLTIPRGGQFFVQLSDGTKVWLNSESRLKYPVTFTDGENRLVELLYGEAYFEVSPSTEHKGSHFKVLTQGQEIEVLGTEFNLKAYRDEPNIYTTLVEGKVTVSTTNIKKTLTPNQQLDFDPVNQRTTISRVNVYNVISWKKGIFSFKSMTLKEIAKVLSRWYDVEVKFDNPALKEVRFNGVLGKDQDLEGILKNIQKTNFINAYEIKNRKITIK